MYDGFIGQRIAATTTALRKLGIWLIIAALAVAFYEARTFFNVQKGPAQFDDTQLSAISNPNTAWRNYATVRGRETFETGLTWIEKTTRNGHLESERTTAQFMAMVVGKHILIVKAKTGEKADQYTGEVASLPDDIKKQIFAEISDPELQAATLPVMLDTTGGYDDLFLAYVPMIALVLAGLWALTLSKRRSDMPERHPLCKLLSVYGPLYSVIPQIDAEVIAGSSTFGSTTFTQHWMVACWLHHAFAMRRDEILWVYKKRTKRSVNFIPIGSTYSLIFRDARGKAMAISNSQEHIDNFMVGIAEQTPWIIMGYDGKLERLYKKNRQQFIQAVADRKTAIQTASV